MNDEPRGCPTPGACSAMQRERELRNLVEDLQEAFAELMKTSPLPGSDKWHEMIRNRGQIPQRTLKACDADTAELAERIRAGLDRLRQEM
jgi:hypothetical protein